MTADSPVLVDVPAIADPLARAILSLRLREPPFCVRMPASIMARGLSYRPRSRFQMDWSGNPRLALHGLRRLSPFSSGRLEPSPICVYIE